MYAKILRQCAEYLTLPRVEINLNLAATAGNDPFYADMVRRHYDLATQRHRKYWIVPQMARGVALCRLPESAERYYMQIQASARRNHKKARREGCSFRRIHFNTHLDQVRQVRQSADARQGKPVPSSFRDGIVNCCTDPPSRNRTHDWPYFGVFRNGEMLGYAGCMVAGEYCGIQHILGHADHLNLGPVPMMIIEIATYLYQHHPQVKYYGYGTYYGSGESMQRFKRKFNFVPHHVTWELGEQRPASPRAEPSLRPL